MVINATVLPILLHPHQYIVLPTLLDPHPLGYILPLIPDTSIVTALLPNRGKRGSFYMFGVFNKNMVAHKSDIDNKFSEIP